uniref:BPTI/Kunitz inhibitor domain-containing protein n=1 Tax=Pseudonaja textilis TaxID=8673 RepID=A0A670ZSC2_PSETE
PPPNSEGGHVCLLPPDCVPCKDKTHHWFYDPKNKRCKKLTSGRCGGNGNDFSTRSECQLRCHKRGGWTTGDPQENVGGPQGNVPPPPPKQLIQAYICTLPPDRGPCNEKLHRWFYEPKTGKCTKFIFGGCEGNANNFNVRWLCRRRCRETRRRKPPGAFRREGGFWNKSLPEGDGGLGCSVCLFPWQGEGGAGCPPLHY